LMLLELLLPTFIQELRELKSFNERTASSFRNTTQELRTMLLLLRHNQQKIERRLDLLNPEVVVWPLSAPWVPSSPCTQSHEVTASAPAMPNDHGLFCPQQQPLSTVSSTVASPPAGAPSPCYDSYFARSEILSYLPFLSSYNLRSPEAPFVVDHLRYAQPALCHFLSPLTAVRWRGVIPVCGPYAANHALPCRSWNSYPGRNSRHPCSYMPTLLSVLLFSIRWYL
jgi:hypothetical protein